MVLALALIAHADVPLPLFPDCTHDTLDQCPSDLREHDWDNTSWVPTDEQPTIRPEELDIGSGIGMDRVIAKTTGHFSVPIASVECGVGSFSSTRGGSGLSRSSSRMAFSASISSRSAARSEPSCCGLSGVETMEQA